MIYRYVTSSRNISVVVISTEYFSNWKRLSLYTVPRKQLGVFLVSNLRLSNSLFSTLQPAESSRRAGAEARSQVFSKITEDTLDTQCENKRREARRNKKETERKRKRRREAVSLKEKQLLFGESVSCVRCLMIDLGHMDNLYNQYHHFHSIKKKSSFTNKSQRVKIQVHVSLRTSMTRKTELGVSWKRRDTESVREAIYPGAAVSSTMQTWETPDRTGEKKKRKKRKHTVLHVTITTTECIFFNFSSQTHCLKLFSS